MSNENQGTPAPEAVTPVIESEESDQSSQDSVDSGVEEALADAQEVVSDPNATKAEKAAAQKTLKSLKIKYNNKEYDEALPFEIPDTDEAKNFMVKHLQMSKMGHVKAQEKAEMEAEIRDFIEAIRNNPEEVLSNPHIGLDLKKFATKIIEQELENEKKSPEQLKAEKLEKELKQIKEEQKKAKEEHDRRERERLQNEAVERYDILLEQALNKNPDLPKSAWVVKRISDYMLLGLQNGMDVNPEDVIPIVREERKKEIAEMFSASNDELLEELIGKERINGMRKKRVADAKKIAAAQASKVQDTGNKQQKEEKLAEKRTIRSVFGV